MADTIYFYGHTNGPYMSFSQFHPAQFQDEDGETYHFAEQYMMAGKARVMGDTETLAKILAAGDPATIKALGRAVKPYDDAAWSAARFEVVRRGNLLKFGQNKALRKVLLATGTATLVEAAANDRIWGIGISVKDALRGAKWNGQNLLGKALMAVREELARDSTAGRAPTLPLAPACGVPPPPPPVAEAPVAEAPAAATAPPAEAPPAAAASRPGRRAPRVQHLDGASPARPAARAATAGAAVAPHGAPGVDYFLVLDFEATCQENDPTWLNEIIEFPAVLVDARTLARVSEFRRFVRPTERPRLTPFCTHLTSITQRDVDEAEPLDAALEAFGAWLGALGLRDGAAVLPVTCGDWDLEKQLPRECARKRLVVPAPLRRWCNVKHMYLRTQLPAQRRGGKAPGMAGMLSALGLPLIGHHHLGIDDSRNIASIVIELARRGVRIEQTGTHVNTAGQRGVARAG